MQIGNGAYCYSCEIRRADNASRKIPISLPGVSIIRIENGKVKDWSDYYDDGRRGGPLWLLISRNVSSSNTRPFLQWPYEADAIERAFKIIGRERKRERERERDAMNTKNEIIYILGHSPAEIRRLKAQAEILRPITERLLLSTGIGPGMRVLDIGYGAGDVAMLAAELVGPSGSVVGIDRNSEVLAIARERAHVAGLRHIAFEDASAEAFVDRTLFDLVIGRYVLLYQSDPAALLRAAARLVKPGGSVAFHELRLLLKCHSVPRVPLLELIDKLIRMAFCGLPNYDAGDG